MDLVLASASFFPLLGVRPAVGRFFTPDEDRPGGSAIVAPTGEIAAQALTEDDELIATALDLELGEYLRRTVFNFAKHRRIEHYGLITSRTGSQNRGVTRPSRVTPAGRSEGACVYG